MRRPLARLLCAALFCLGAANAAEAPKKNQVPPKAIKQERPHYPENLRQLGLRGSVKVEFVIDQEGAVQDPVVVQSNNPWFERPAMDSILKWKFSPATVDGKKVKTRASQEIIFDMWGGGSTPWTLANLKARKSLPPEMQWDVAPEPVHTAYPVYPFDALRAGQKGRTKIAYAIDTEGRVQHARVVEATTPEMGHAVLAMIDTWRFKPAQRKDGTKVATIFGMEHEFLPTDSSDVPVSLRARDILRDLEKKPAAIVSPDSLDQPLKPLSRRPPAYPSTLKQADQEGEALIEFFVDERGDVQLPRVISCSAPEFGYAAAHAVATWRFEPPRKDRKTVTTRVRVPVNFGLKAPRPAGAK
jgi:TonB family protein